MTAARLIAALALAAAALPLPASAATYLQARTLVISESPADNLYVAGTDIAAVAELPGDMLGAGGTLRVAAPVAGDAILAGGSIAIEQAVAGDVRAAGGQVSVTGPVTGDLVLAGGSVYASSTAADTRIFGGSVRVAGSGGAARIYGANVELSGTFRGDVTVLATDSIRLAEGTVIEGALRYDAPQEAAIPASAAVAGGVTYTGASYLPTTEQAQTFALAGAGVFLIVRILSLLIGAGLLAGLFPQLAQKVADRALLPSFGSFALLALLGFAVLVAAPVFILLLFVSFVGAVPGLILLLSYLLLVLLAYLFAGIIAGAALGRGLLKRPLVSWRLALLGMATLYLVGSVPAIGGLIAFILFLASLGTLTLIAYRFAFRREDPALTLDDYAA